MSENNKVVTALSASILLLATAIISFLIYSAVSGQGAAHQTMHNSHMGGAGDIAYSESGEIISRNGLHYHPKLDIYINGKKQTIPANVGAGAVHMPIHTHAKDNIIHLEFSGVVTLDNTRLQEFFKIWGKQFNSNCIFEFCNGPSGTVKMFVNGQINNDFEKHPMKKADRIEIRYE